MEFLQNSGKTSLLENPKFPGIFVTKKKKSGKSNENEGNDHVKKERTSDSPTSDLGSDQCLSESISTSTAVYNFSSVKEVENGGDSSCSYDNHCSCSESTEHGTDENDDKDGSKRARRKKSKEKTEENPAVDAVRYKTKMCKNWQMSQKCPYGPRCLFAHGAKELRSHTLNQAAIGFASVSSSPERQFFALGRFPSFMPIPFNSMTSEDGKESVVEEQRENIQHTVQVTTHKPYSFPSPLKQELQQNVSQPDFQQVYPPSFVHQNNCEQNAFLDSRVSFVTGPVNPYSASQFSAIELYGQNAALNAIACAFRSATCSLVVPPMEPLRR